MSTKEEQLGADVLRLVDHFHRRSNGRKRRLPPLHSAVTTAFEAVALMSLVHRLASSRGLRLASAATAAYLKRQADRQHERNH
jgi:hypothetical protein